MKILCIEDGSVDLENLPDRKEWRDDKVLVYRQGSRPPFVLDITEESQNKILSEKYDSLLEEIEVLNERWRKLKEFVQNDHDSNLENGNNDCALGQRWVLQQMSILEED
jgi:hypothetical protein